MSAPSAKVWAKVNRILLTGTIRFSELTPTRARCQVIGDGDDYQLVYRDGRYECTCPHVGQCSHKLVMEKVLRAVLPALDATKGAGYNGREASGEGRDGRDVWGE